MKDDICNYGMTEMPDWFKAEIEKKGKARRAEMLELADILDRALHREKRVNRVLTLEEVKEWGSKLDEIVYLEADSDSGWYAPDARVSETGEYSALSFLIPGIEEEREWPEQMYGQTWRCWKYRPTEEESSGTPWKK